MTARLYVGCIAGSPTREVFRSAATPTADSHGDRFAACIGPFRTRRGADYMARYGRGNPHPQQVADAERFAAIEASTTGVKQP